MLLSKTLQIIKTITPPTTVTNTQNIKLPNNFDVVELTIFSLTFFILGMIFHRFLIRLGSENGCRGDCNISY